MPKNKHLTDEERLHIERLLKERVSIKQIAVKLGKSTSTISREIRAHAVASDKSAPHRIPNRCIKRYDCNKRYLCEDKPVYGWFVFSVFNKLVEFFKILSFLGNIGTKNYSSFHADDSKKAF